METTKVFTKLLDAYRDPTVRVIVMKGSSRSSKTWSILQLLTIIAARSTKPRLISVVSESMPHLKRGAIRDFETFMRADRIFNNHDWNATDKIYRIGLSAIEFFGVESAGKVHGAARDVLYINEAINIEYEVYRQLAIRTSEKLILDYNPLYSSWIDEKVLGKEGAVMIHSTYLDNDMLPIAQVREIEAQRLTDPDWFNVYGLGVTGSREGLVLRNWDIVPAMPTVFKSEWLGIDFGYAVPTAIAHIRLSQGEVYIRQVAYERQLDNLMIADTIKAAGLAHIHIIADSAEPKSIAELRNCGLRIEPCDKTKTVSDMTSIQLGLQIMNRYTKHYTSDSVDFIYENRNYRYGKDVNGVYSGTPIKKNDHSIDASRYVFLKHLANIRRGGGMTYTKR